jgi:hypothetical protein
LHSVFSWHFGARALSGYGLDRALYTFVVIPRIAIPCFKKLFDSSYHGNKYDGKLPEPKKGRLISRLRVGALIAAKSIQLLNVMLGMAENSFYSWLSS